MTTQQLIDAIKASTITIEVPSPEWHGFTVAKNVIDADAFLAAVERLAEAEKS